MQTNQSHQLNSSPLTAVFYENPNFMRLVLIFSTKKVTHCWLVSIHYVLSQTLAADWAKWQV